MDECKIGTRLTRLRTEAGATQDEVAAVLGISGKTISKWECGASEPSLSMLIALSKYYGVSTDLLLGISESREKADSIEIIRSELKGLDRDHAISKVFELARSLIPAMYKESAVFNSDSRAVPEESSSLRRSQLALNDFYCFTAASDDVNTAVMLLNNSSKFSWLKEPEKKARISRLFSFLADEDALSIMYFINSTACSKSFTADHISDKLGLTEERTAAILNELCEIGECRRFTAHLAAGDIEVYEFYGDGLILSIISLAYEQMCGKRSYDYNLNGFCRMIEEA